ncbi:MAG: 3-dehydroquinate synthase [Gammaproteobacteria bacterium]|jgi:3-dehydroquinate synthase
MNTITVSLGKRSYPIHIGAGLLADAATLEQSTDASQLLIVTNEIVAPLYLDRVERAFADRHPKSLILPDGEQYKNLESFARIIDELIEAGFHRDACILALGGGVVGDLAGFAAASYQRGIDFVQLPTTLLAQVDSSVGGKTAVNHPRAKNMIGAFHQPIAVVSDTDTLGTLPPRQLSAGLAEVIKYGLIEDLEFFVWLEENIASLRELDPEALRVAISRCCEIKASIVAQDELEHGKRALLNLGHTFGHAIEALGGYGRWLHGEAVAIGMLMAAETSVLLGRIDRTDTERIGELLASAGLPVSAAGLPVNAIIDTMQLDKKAGSDGLKLVLLDRLGSARVVPAPAKQILESSIERRLAGEP